MLVLFKALSWGCRDVSVPKVFLPRAGYHRSFSQSS